MNTHQTIYLSNYQPPDYEVSHIDLTFQLDEDITTVRSIQKIQRSQTNHAGQCPLILNGIQLQLMSIALDGTPLTEDAYVIDKESLTLHDLPETFTLDITTRIFPKKNTSLEGLFSSGSMLCTQCEAEGFRKITYFLDRPDIMSTYSCHLYAKQSKYPVLLSNGNMCKHGQTENGYHFVSWEDPFKKPSYLFALVAGDLLCIEDSFITCSGRKIQLRLYVEHMNGDKCDHAMKSLKKAMKWDEDVFGREYDLDLYMIVAVNDFNMGAMENKGLNIFNAKSVLAKPETATDNDYFNIERCVAHEYFHNWTGNRITLRNWFQLCLKEGLTVFRDQDFSANMYSESVQRIMDVRKLRTFQFPEDSGPTAHAVRPESYIEMNNFYTTTIYEKGAEIIRMLREVIGHDMFYKGMDAYFNEYDGQAVTIEDFIHVMASVSGIDLEQFKLWYSQAGTPTINVKRTYHPNEKRYTLQLTQACPSTPGQPNKKSMVIPCRLGLLDPLGNELPLTLSKDSTTDLSNQTICLNKTTETLIFENVETNPIPSLFRHFSAPIKLTMDYSDDELIFLMANDTDMFNRWEACQKLMNRTLLSMIKHVQTNQSFSFPGSIIEAFGKILTQTQLDQSFVAEILQLPSEMNIGYAMSDAGETIDPDVIYQVRLDVLQLIARHLQTQFKQIYDSNQENGPYQIDAQSVGRRRLKNCALYYLGQMKTNFDLVYNQCIHATNMTDTIEALSILTHIDCPEREKALQIFFDQWHQDPLVLDKWFAIQAQSRLPNTLQTVKKLMHHPAFSIKNPNRVRALIGSFIMENRKHFHTITGEGYQFLTDQVLTLNQINPLMASRMVVSFNAWKKYNSSRQYLIQTQLKRILQEPDLSKDVYEMVSKALDD